MDTSRHFTDEFRRRLPKAQVTSRLSTATDSLPGVASLNNSRSLLDKSAERIATYVTVYGRKRADRSGRSSRASSHSHRPDESSTDSHPVPHPNAPIASAQLTHRSQTRALGRQVEALREYVSLAKSDWMELKRDLATYEMRFGREVGLQEKLQEIRSTAEALPVVMDALTQVSELSKRTFATMKENIHLLCRLQSTSSLRPRAGLRKANTGLRTISTNHHIKSAFRGCVSISGLKCFAQVFTDFSLGHFRISVQTLPGDHFSLAFSYQLLHDLPPRTAIEQRIIPKLFLQSQEQQWGLSFAPEHGNAFRTVVTKVRGVSGYFCLVLIQDDDAVRIRSEDFDCFVSIPTTELTDCGSVYEMACAQIQSVLSQKLTICMNPNRLVWLETADSLFASKESHSQLLDPDFLSEALGEFLLALTAKEDLYIDGQLYAVEIYTYRSIESLKVTHCGRSVEVHMGSRLFSFLQSLQFSLFQLSPKSLFRSVELQFAVRSLFD